MSTPVLGIIISALCVVLLFLLFRFERARGSRVFGSGREMLDRVIAKIEYSCGAACRYIGREMPRQSLHYFFHTVLVTLLRLLKRCERVVTNVMRRNRTVARRIVGERTSRNKLDEIADHKASVAMTERQKKAHREKMLEG